MDAAKGAGGPVLSDQAYTYHGDDDALTSWNRMFTSRNGDGEGDPEENFLSAIRLVAACKAGGDFLDIGSGIGRIIDLIRRDAASVVGLEPDNGRYLGCKNGFAPDRRIEMFNLKSWDYRQQNGGRRFDFITVSMVVQHVSTGACRQIFSDVHDLLAPNGSALISTTHFYEERFSYEADPSAHEVAEFDRYADQMTSQDKGLPVRMFSRASLHQEIERAGLEVVAWQQFAYPRPDRATEVAGFFAGPPEEMRDRGVSQYAVVRRPVAAPQAGWKSRLRRRLGMRPGGA